MGTRIQPEVISHLLQVQANLSEGSPGDCQVCGGCSERPRGTPEREALSDVPCRLHSARRQYFKTAGEGQRFLLLESHQRAKRHPKGVNNSSRILSPKLPLLSSC